MNKHKYTEYQKNYLKLTSPINTKGQVNWRRLGYCIFYIKNFLKVKVESESLLIGLIIDLICLAVDWASPIQL